MLWRLRARLPDQPGALAPFADLCGQAGVNILGLQIFPETHTATDEFVLALPLGWGSEEIADLVEEAGGLYVDAVEASEEARADQPTRYVSAARQVISDPTTFPAVAAQLFDADVDNGVETMEMIVGEVGVQIRRQTPFTAVEQARGDAMAALVSDAMGLTKPKTESSQSADDGQSVSSSGSRRMGEGARTVYDVHGSEVTASVAGQVVGRARLRTAEEEGVRHVDLDVDHTWRRRGIGTRLLSESIKLATETGAEEAVLTARADNQAVLPMVLGAGMRGRIKMAGDHLTVRIGLTSLR